MMSKGVLSIQCSLYVFKAVEFLFVATWLAKGYFIEKFQ